MIASIKGMVIPIMFDINAIKNRCHYVDIRKNSICFGDQAVILTGTGLGNELYGPVIPCARPVRSSSGKPVAPIYRYQQ